MLQIELTKALLQNLHNFHIDNHDSYRFGPSPYEKNLFNKLRYSLVKKMAEFGFVYFRRHGQDISQQYNKLSNHMNDLEIVYDSLEDDESKALMVKLLAFYVLGKYRVKLPLNNQKYWDSLQKVGQLANRNDSITAPHGCQKLSLYDLSPIEIPVRLYFTAKGVLNDFILNQYEYKSLGRKTVHAEKGDVVIDAGGCYGDTALYFANQVGTTGRVFVFEFIPSNIEIATKNIELNPGVFPVITLVRHPLWSQHGMEMFYVDKGPGSNVSFEKIGDNKVVTETIDNYVRKQSISRVDFIKMDIEGAEMFALRGASETIRKFRPKLAISVYHSIDDFSNVPQFIKTIDPNYKLYLGHYTIHREETVLFAVVD